MAPGITDPESFGGGEIEIVENRADRQAVYNRAEDRLQAVFYRAGELQYKGVVLTVEHPCAIIVKGWSGEKPEVLLSDPAYKMKEIGWQIRRNGKNVKGKSKVTLSLYR
ncbi:MAG: hypothetical protein EGP82_13980 [Odoribacter splanchnicus]|nr:hypothetical protein [Odoribacter splanchnicus]